VITQTDQQIGHPAGTARDAPMLPLVTREITAFDSLGQNARLPERQAEAFAGDRVYRAGGIARQCDMAAINRLQPAG